jgi:hypothetical protein
MGDSTEYPGLIHAVQRLPLLASAFFPSQILELHYHLGIAGHSYPQQQQMDTKKAMGKVIILWRFSFTCN